VKALAYLNKYFVKYKWYLILGTLFTIISNLFGIIPAQLVRYALDLVRETLDIVDRACIIYGGQVLFAGTPQDLVADENVRRLYLGENFTL